MFYKYVKNEPHRISGIKKGLGKIPESLFYMVPRAGVEPARPYERGILSLTKPKNTSTTQQTRIVKSDS